MDGRVESKTRDIDWGGGHHISPVGPAEQVQHNPPRRGRGPGQECTENTGAGAEISFCRDVPMLHVMF